MKRNLKFECGIHRWVIRYDQLLRLLIQWLAIRPYDAIEEPVEEV